MPKPAQGNWPQNVSAVIITPEEKAAQLRQAPPGGQVTNQVVHPQGAPYATVQVRHIIPNVLPTPRKAGAPMTDQDPQNPIQPEQPQPTEQPTEDTEVFYGRQALVLAKQLSVDVVWKTETGEPVDIETAKALIASQGPNAVFFDFEALATLPEVQDEIETAVEQTDPYLAQLPLPPDETLAGQQVPPGMMQSSQSVPGQQYVDPISDRERMAFGNVLTTPGQTVYIRPNVIRVEVEGNVRVQKGRQGNVRMMRIVRLDPSGSERVADAFRTTVQAPMVRSPNPAVTYRQSQAVMQDRVPVPKPKVPVPNVNKNSGIADAFEEFDF